MFNVDEESLVLSVVILDGKFGLAVIVALTCFIKFSDFKYTFVKSKLFAEKLMVLAKMVEFFNAKFPLKNTDLDVVITPKSTVELLFR